MATRPEVKSVRIRNFQEKVRRSKLPQMLFNEPTPIPIVILLSDKINILVFTIVKKESKISRLMVVKVGLCASRDIFIM